MKIKEFIARILLIIATFLSSIIITNKNVQEIFGVSQITASRDLSKLASLGLIIARGKGISVYYTRV